jgi:hypothetical protein
VILCGKPPVYKLVFLWQHLFFFFFCCIFDNHTCIFCSLYSEPWNVSFGFPLKVYRISKPDSKTNTR